MYFPFSLIMVILIVGKWIIESKQFKSIIMKNLIKAIKNSIRKYPHSWRIFLAAVIAGVEAVMGQQFADNAKTNGGFVIWCIAQAFAAIAFVYLVFHTGKVGAGDPE